MSHLIHKNEKGVVLTLPLGLIFLAFVAILGTTAVIVTTTDIKISGNYKTAQQAFYAAEAGVQFAIAKIEEGLKANPQAFSLPTIIGTPSNLTYEAPTGFLFDISGISLIGVNTYSLRVTGSSGNARSTVEVVFKRNPLFRYGAFGDRVLDLKASGAVYSYDSSVISDPVPSDSTGDGDVGSNELVRVYNGTLIDGDVDLGDDGGDPVDEADFQKTPTSNIIYSIIGDITDVPRVDPDPLGARGGDLADDFVTYSDSNFNDNAIAGITDNTILLDNNNDTLTLTAGNYYLDSIMLLNGTTLNIDATDGEINIYLTGSLTSITDSMINFTGFPRDLTIFSNSSLSIVFMHNTNFKGTVYAPYAKIDMKNGSDVCGMIWGNEVYMKNTGQFYFDMALNDKWLADTFNIVSWKEVIN